MTKYIYYSGIGSKKSGKHNVEEFLDIMNKKYGITCSQNITNLEYGPCIAKNKMDVIEYAKCTRKIKKGQKCTTARNKKKQRNYNLCTKRQKTLKKRKCTLEQYMDFVGAEM